MFPTLRTGGAKTKCYTPNDGTNQQQANQPKDDKESRHGVHLFSEWFILSPKFVLHLLLA